VRALVTGSAGFVGRHTVDRLNLMGWNTVGLDLADGYDALARFRFDTDRYDLVVHAAASAPHRAAIDGEPQHFARNLQLDSAMFDWAVRTGQGRVLYLSSSAAYPIEYQSDLTLRMPLHEGMIGPHCASEPDSVYGWAKLTGERLAAEARRAGLPVTVVRPFSGYGTDQSPDFPFRAILDRVARREDPLTVWGAGTQVRDWIHIDDVVGGMLAVAESGTELPVNLCTGVGTSMFELAQLAARVAGYAPRIEPLTDKPGGVAYRVGDPARFHQVFGPDVTLEEGIVRALRA
jgi:nucleoside-diphosphate-sugar epimerase